MSFIKKLEKRIAANREQNRYYHGSPKDHGDILKVLPFGESEGHDFGGIFLTQEGLGGHMGPSKNVWYFIDLKDSEILSTNDLYYRHSDKDPKIKEVLERFSDDDEKTGVWEFEGDEDKRSKDDFIWDLICERKSRNTDHSRLIHLFGESGEWELQTIQGQIAKALGFKAVEMTDETGTVYLLVGPNKMRKMTKDDLSNMS